MKKIFIILLLAFGLIGNCFASFPTTQVLDNFNRANSGSLGSNWTQDFGDTWGIISDQASTNTTTNGYAGIYWNQGQFQNVEVYATIENIPVVGDDIALLARMNIVSGADYQVMYDHETVSEIYINYYDGTNTNQLKSFTKTMAIGDSFGLSCIGSTLEAWYQPSGGSWTLLGSVTDTNLTSAGYVGMFGDTEVGTPVIFDNFGGGVANPTASVNSYKANWYNANQY